MSAYRAKAMVAFLNDIQQFPVLSVSLDLFVFVWATWSWWRKHRSCCWNISVSADSDNCQMVVRLHLFGEWCRPTVFFTPPPSPLDRNEDEVETNELDLCHICLEMKTKILPTILLCQLSQPTISELYMTGVASWSPKVLCDWMNLC